MPKIVLVPAWYPGFTGIIGLFLNKDVVVANINTFSSLEKRPNIDFLNAFNEEKVNNPIFGFGLLSLEPRGAPLKQAKRQEFSTTKVNRAWK